MSIAQGGQVMAMFEEARERVMKKVEEIRGRVGGANSPLIKGGKGVLGKGVLGQRKIIGTLGILNRKGILGQNAIVRRFTAAGPRTYISKPRWYDSHTLSAAELRARNRGGPLSIPLKKDSVVPEPVVAPKVLSK